MALAFGPIDFARRHGALHALAVDQQLPPRKASTTSRDCALTPSK
jgi:hypothetical protein